MWDLCALAGWAYLVIFLITVVDSFLPVLPAETTIFAGGALAAAGDLDPVVVVLSVAAAATVGDLITHELARRGLGNRLLRRVLRGDRATRAVDRAQRSLYRRGPVVVALGRFIPLGRTAVAVTSGYARYPRRAYLSALLVGSTLWSLYVVGVGYLGGHATGNPLVSVALGIALSIVVTATATLVRRAWRRTLSRRGATRAWFGATPQRASCR